MKEATDDQEKERFAVDLGAQKEKLLVKRANLKVLAIGQIAGGETWQHELSAICWPNKREVVTCLLPAPGNAVFRHACASCGATENLLICEQCHVARFCNETCLQQGFAAHKSFFCFACRAALSYS